MQKFFTIIKSYSSRINRKNFQYIFNRIPLWIWSISRYQSESIEIYVNTDSQEILDYLEETKIAIGIKRCRKHIEWEKNSANQGSPVEDMLQDFCINYTEKAEEPIVLFHVTSPFVELATVMDAISFLEKGYDSVQSVKEIQNFSFKLNDDEISPINYNSEIIQRTQDLSPIYLSNGAFFIARSGDIIRTGKRSPGNSFCYKLNEMESFEIDNIDQLHMARIIAKYISDNQNYNL